MRQIPKEQSLNGKVFRPAFCANVTVREVMTQMHCIRLAYLHKSQTLSCVTGIAPYPGFKMRVVLSRTRQCGVQVGVVGPSPERSGRVP
jgi:hypothetical protein